MGKRTNSGLSAAGARSAGARASAGLAALWCEKLGELATGCAAAFIEDEADRVWTLRDLLARAPEPALVVGLQVPPRDRFENLIEAGACAAAVMAMIDGAAGYLLSRGSAGLHAASIYLPDAMEEVTAVGDSAALALVGAIAQALVDRHASREPAPLHLN
ncbi:MAG TPA: hypothetical protein VI199_12295 [Novosphingobium sp.]